jgi:hypothetical protein
MPAIVSTSGRLHIEFVRILFLQAHWETDRFFAASGVQLAQHNRGAVLPLPPRGVLQPDYGKNGQYFSLSFSSTFNFKYRWFAHHI